TCPLQVATALLRGEKNSTRAVCIRPGDEKTGDNRNQTPELRLIFAEFGACFAELKVKFAEFRIEFAEFRSRSAEFPFTPMDDMDVMDIVDTLPRGNFTRYNEGQ